MAFIYRSGQRPLAGYTIKRGLGQGGFGEVYHAQSDGDKEVALKYLYAHSDKELRGVAHCINFKHPNLVHLYDIRTDDKGNKWVVMEYAFGKSLADILRENPHGLGVETARGYFSEIAQGVAYLHDQGVVHRDLKPANALVENGHIKITDYGMTRRITASPARDLTRGTGTAIYMAPEIKNGNYTRSVDIYSCGIILYEMLTGAPPFVGESPEEVLIKHQCDSPDLSKLPPEFIPILAKALEKDPALRYASMTEFARAVEALGSASDKRAASSRPILLQPVAIPPSLRSPELGMESYRPEQMRHLGRERFTELCGSMGIAPLVVAVCTLPFALLSPTPGFASLVRIFLLSIALTWAILIAARPPRPDDRAAWGRRLHLLLAGMAVGVFAVWLDGWGVPSGVSSVVHFTIAQPTPEALSIAMRYVLYFGLATAAGRWWRLTDRNRRDWFRLLPLMGAGIWGVIFLFLWPWEAAFWRQGVAPLVVAAATVQVVSPWSPPIPQPRFARVRRRRTRYAEYAA